MATASNVPRAAPSASLPKTAPEAPLGPEPEAMDDAAQLAQALAQGPVPSGNTAAPTTLPSVTSPQEQLAQLMQLMQAYSEMGVLERRQDGSYVFAGMEDSARKERERRGSECRCDLCSPHNQRHWICVSCGSVFEWVIVRPKASWPLLGEANKPGILHAVCGDACAREYLHSRGRYQSGENVPLVAAQRVVPVAGGDDGFGILGMTG